MMQTSCYEIKLRKLVRKDYFILQEKYCFRLNFFLFDSECLKWK